ncbi:glycosyltransferase [Rhizobium sp. RAF56]|uniref:glycosyltransferase n=1 Tax=Rhizobium sp. RAF56 TaxID=3233062 RepID=UPI003F99568D
MLISIIIPVRVSDALFQGLPRIEKLLASIPREGFEAVIVDYGSSRREAEELQAIADKFSHARNIRVEAETEPFSAGIARNIGAEHAMGSVIMFNDVDCIASPHMYRRIAEEAEARRIDINVYDFFSIPIAFTTYEGADEYTRLQAEDPRRADALFHYHMIRGEKQFVFMMAYSGSTIVVNRLQYLAIGGTNQQFHGHGAEDFEVKLRLAGYRPIGVKPIDYYHNTKVNQMQDYVGFRSYLALYGYEIAFRGIYMVHLWHPSRVSKSVTVSPSSSGYMQTERNFRLMRQMMRDFDTSGSQPAALMDCASDRKTLVLCRPNSTALETLRHVLPLLGRFDVVDEVVFENDEAFLDTIRRDGFTNVLLLNPYGNPHRLSLYESLRREGIPYWVHDRGALPHSWFFDPSGFNADSPSYAPNRWDRPLSDEERSAVRSYIQTVKTKADTLEINGPPKSASHWRSVFGIGPRKVLFVPLQRPSDTVTRYFGGAVGAYENFYDWIEDVALHLDRSEWVVVVKKHPAELIKPSIQGVIFAPDDAHVHDLIELSDASMMLNSGVGVLSLAFGKPVITCGGAFYAHHGLAVNANSVEEAVRLVQTGVPIDRAKVESFIHYLVTEFYSFGETVYIEHDNGSSKFQAASKISYQSVRGLTEKPVLFGGIPATASFDSLVYSSFGGPATMKRAKESELKGRVEKKTPLTAPAQAQAAVAPSVYDELIASARKAWNECRYADAANYNTKAANENHAKAVHHLCEAAEACIRNNDKNGAVNRLMKALTIAPGNKAIKRRIRELNRPKWLSAILKPQPFPVKA